VLLLMLLMLLLLLLLLLVMPRQSPPRLLRPAELCCGRAKRSCTFLRC
jgi:hypothetical protein